MKDDLRAKGTVELDCVKCGWTSWFEPLDPKVQEAAETGNYVCDQCLGIRVSHPKRP